MSLVKQFRAGWLIASLGLVSISTLLACILLLRDSPGVSGIKGWVQCAAPVLSCKAGPARAFVYVMSSHDRFNPFDPPSSRYETDLSGHFEIPLAPGTYWVAAAKDRGDYASEGAKEVVVSKGRMAN